MGILDTLMNRLGRKVCDGATPDTAIVVDSVDDEYAWLRQHCPGLTLGPQSFTEMDGRCFDIFQLQDASGTVVRTVHFDVTSFMGDDDTAASTAQAPDSDIDVPASNAYTLFPLDNAEAYLRPQRAGLERDGTCLRWPDRDGVTELRVDPINHHTHDDLLVSELVTLTHSSPALSALDANMAMLLNKWATLSALVPADDEHPTRLVCKVGVFSSDRAAAERNYAPLICTEAAIIGFHAACLARGIVKGDPDNSPLMQTGDPPPFDAADFEAIKALTDRNGYFGSRSDDSFTVEFPWESGAVSNLFAYEDMRESALKAQDYSPEQLDRMGGRTSLFQLTTAESHALYGRGVLSRLEIPLPIDGPDVASLVDELNRWELSGADLAPQFGAWCKGPRAPTFVTFIPTQLCYPGLLHHLTVWTHVRHKRVREWLSASTIRN